MMISSKVKIRWQSKKLQIQGAQILRNKAYLQYAAMTKDAAQRRRWTFYEAIKHEKDFKPQKKERSRQ
jgi:hypothetical protein